jgi:amino acid adenylation domain-containing protein
VNTLQNAPRRAHTLTLEEMRCRIAELAGQAVEEVGDDDDLIAVGLDSIDVMKLASIWCSLGAQVQFGELLERRTLREWWSLVSSRMRTPPGDAPQPTALDDGKPFELAPMQYAYWFGRSHGQSLSAPSHFYFEFDGEGIDPRRLEIAVRRLMERHAMLRAQFLDDGRQQILAEAPWPGLKVRDLRGLDEAEAAARLQRVREAESGRRLEVEQGLGFDVQLSLISPGVTRLHINIDMLVADAASFRIIISELATLYAHAEEPLPPVSYSYRQYLADKQKQGIDEGHRQYWAERLGTLPGPPQLPFATEPTRLKQTRTVRHEHKIGRAEWDRLARNARAHGLTLPMVFLTAFSEVLAAWSTSTKFLLNLPLFDRQPLGTDVDRLVGDFTGSILLEADLSDSCSFAEQARRLQERFRSDVAHSGYPGVSVLRDLWRSNPEARMLAPVVFTSALNMGELFSDLVRSSFGHLTWMISQTPQVWLDNQIVENEGHLLINWDALDGLFSDGVLDSMFAAYCRLLHHLAAPDCDWHSPLPQLLPPEQELVRRHVNQTSGAESGRLLHEAFFERADREPQRVAVLSGGSTQLSYGELSQAARRLGALLRARGVEAGESVAISLPKGAAQVVAVLGVLSIGAVYVPVAVEQPSARRERITENAGVRVMIDQAMMEESLSYEPLSSVEKIGNEELAYIIYTSGSTGEPKGVEITHRAAMNTIEAINERYGVCGEDRALGVSGLEFDLSVYDIFGMLSCGGSVVMLEGESGRRDAVEWAEQVKGRGVTVWNSVPALLEMLLIAASADQLESLRLVLLGGDRVGVDLPSRLGERAPGCRFVALGGATETAIHSTVCEVSEPKPEWHCIPYGIPLRNVRCRVVDERGRDCPDWVSGQLWIGGVGLAKGYRNNPLATHTRFLQLDGQRWYLTGDLGRYWPDGTLEFLGRADYQVKIRGHRIELGEVEAALQSHPQVESAVAVAFGEGRQRLGAVIVAQEVEPGEGEQQESKQQESLDEASLDKERVREYVSRMVPSYMVPQQIVRLERMPLSSNGKVDRQRIMEVMEEAWQQQRERAAAGEGSVGAAPRTEMEERLGGLWEELLGCGEVRRESNFFALGGDSLLATRLVQEARQRFGLEIPLRAIFSSLALADLAALVEQLENETETGIIA